jgi:hypothetical protein
MLYDLVIGVAVGVGVGVGVGFTLVVEVDVEGGDWTTNVSQVSWP